LISNNSIRERRKGEKKQENTGQNSVTKAEERKGGGMAMHTK
jgi:hypothetical protein